MDKMKDLAEQHILESASRLRHIDELMARVRTAPLEAETATRTAALLRQIESDRNKLARELEELQRLPRGEGSDIVKRGEGLKGLLESVGLQSAKETERRESILQRTRSVIAAQRLFVAGSKPSSA